MSRDTLLGRTTHPSAKYPSAAFLTALIEKSSFLPVSRGYNKQVNPSKKTIQ